MPSSFIYLKTELNADIIGGVYMDNLIDIKYLNTKSIIDFNGREIKANTYGKSWLNRYQNFALKDKLDVENYSRYILWFIAGGIVYWLTFGIFTNKSVLPVLFLILAF